MSMVNPNKIPNPFHVILRKNCPYGWQHGKQRLGVWIVAVLCTMNFRRKFSRNKTITVHWLRIKVAIIYTPCCKLACFICFIEVQEFGFSESE